MTSHGILVASKESVIGHRGPERLGCYNAAGQTEVSGENRSVGRGSPLGVPSSPVLSHVTRDMVKDSKTVGGVIISTIFGASAMF